MSARHALSRASDYDRVLTDWRVRWIETARAKQLPPPGDWDIWAFIAGRGFGKTRLGAEHTGYLAASRARTRWAVVSPTQDDCRSVCFEGQGGLVDVIPPALIRRYNSSRLTIELKNGSLIIGKSAEKPDRLRGPQWHGAWCDELASWGTASKNKKKATDGAKDRLTGTWDNLQFGLRLGTKPRVLITTTPRPLPFLRALKTNPRCVVKTGSTFENAANLAPSALAAFKEVYAGTRLGRQELYAEILDDAAGALWSWAVLEREGGRAPQLDPGGYVKIVVAIDPAVTSEDDSDETGIIVAGLRSDNSVDVLEDMSGKYSPREWARIALSAHERFQASAIVGETNQGGDLVEANLRAEADGHHFLYKGVHAKRGKYLRAEPVAALYEKHRVRHCGKFPELENQMVNFTGSSGDSSPDRLDALVYAVSELSLGTFRHAFS